MSDIKDTDVPEEKVDYLEVDTQISGQNYVCLSFISPEDLIQNKEAFKAVKFLQSYCKSEKLNFKEVYDKYTNFVYKYQDELQRDFDEQNQFHTSVRGVKVRGVFDTQEAATQHAKKLSTIDSNFHVFIGQMGYWLPWDPTADKIKDEVFQNSQLNDMMEKYSENNVNRDIFYEEQKREKVKAAQEEARIANEKNKKEEEEKHVQLENKTYDIEDDKEDDKEDDNKIETMVEKIGTTESEVTETIEKAVAEKVEEGVEKVEEGAEKVEEGAEKVEEVVEKVEEGAEKVEEGAEKVGSVVDAKLKESIEGVDPWMQRKTE